MRLECLTIGQARRQFIAEPDSPTASKKHRHRKNRDERHQHSWFSRQKAMNKVEPRHTEAHE